MEKAERMIKHLLEKRADLLTWLSVFLSVIFLRSFVEQFLAISTPLTILETIMEFIHNLYFFSLSSLLIWLFLSFIIKVKPQKLSYLLLFSLVLVVMPSFMDMLKTQGVIYWSFYLLSSPSDLFQQYISIFGHLPSGVVYFGTKITFILTVFCAAILVWLTTKSAIRTFFATLGTYSILFFMGAFPSFFYYGYTFLTRTGRISDVHSFEIASFFGSPKHIFGVIFPSFKYTLAYKLDYIYFIFLLCLLSWMFWLISREKFVAVVKNLRLPQIIYHAGMFFIGMGLGFLQYGQNFRLDLFSTLSVAVLLGSICLSWMASVVVNDMNDFRIDEISNQDRPLPKKIFTLEKYSQFGLACFALAILGGLTIGLPFAVLLLVYQILAWFYSAAPYRLKRFPFLATLISSFASLCILFLGYILVSSDQTLTGLSWRIIILLMLAYTISLPIKDFKDIEGDRADGVWTVPVIFGERKGRLIVATSIFISYMLSIFFLNEMRLFFWALIFAAVTFKVVTNEKIKPRALPAWVLGIVSIYTLILVRIVFMR
ncbi:MAG: UbiA family prenyltransferase [Parcubacteria group bacterium]